MSKNMDTIIHFYCVSKIAITIENLFLVSYVWGELGYKIDDIIDLATHMVSQDLNDII